MFPRVVSLLLAPTLLVQAMAFCPFQCDTCFHEPEEHDQRPHFHLCAVGLWRHADKDLHAAQHGKPNSRNVPTLGRQSSSRDHDDDAIYVSALLVAGRRSSASHSASGSHSVSVPADTLVGGPLAPGRAPVLAHLKPSFLCRICSISSRTLPLLI